MIQRIGYWIMRLFRDRASGSMYLDNPNHCARLVWYPDGEDEGYRCCVLNSESPSDQVWLGRSDKWFVFYGGTEFRRMALWALWRWAWGDWFGLKTRFWLWGLKLRCKPRASRPDVEPPVSL